MYPVRKLTDAVFWVGASDRRLSLFENLFPLPRGVAYNSYLILDEKTALVDTVDASVTQPFLENVLHVLNGRSLDYLVIDHVEPDHLSLIHISLADVLGFMALGGDSCRLCGYWKVYGDVTYARECFRRFDQCRNLLCCGLQSGQSLLQLLNGTIQKAA